MIFYFHLAEKHYNTLIWDLENCRNKYTNLQCLCHEWQAPLRGHLSAVRNLYTQTLPSWLFYILHHICVLPSSALITKL